MASFGQTAVDSPTSSQTQIQEKRYDAVQVTGSIETRSASALGEFTLGGSDIRNLSTVLADDPFRALQAVPGVASNNDFQAAFSLRGAEFSRLGVYVDGVELHNAMHQLEGTDLSGSASIFNPEMVQEMKLYSGPYPNEYGNASAGIVAVELPDANYRRYSFKAEANFATAGFDASGPLGTGGHCSWISGFRKSYLQALLSSSMADPSMVFGVQDESGHMACSVGTGHRFTLNFVDSTTGLDRSSLQKQLLHDSLMMLHQHTSLVNLGWLYTPTDRVFVITHAAYQFDNYDDENPQVITDSYGRYHESAVYSTLNWSVSPQNSFQAGADLRRITAAGFDHAPVNVFGAQVPAAEFWTGSGYLGGAFVQDSVSLRRWRITAGERRDSDSIDGVGVWSPHAALSFRGSATTVLEASFGQYAQFPDIARLGSNLGSPSLLPARSSQGEVGIRQELGAGILVRASVYNRQDRDLLDQPWADPRLIAGRLFLPSLQPEWLNSLRGYARGAEITIQRSGAKRVSGWVSYAYGRTRMHEGVFGDSFPADFDQRHTANAYMNYRWRPSVDLSARWVYGSGFPAPGFLQVVGPVQDQNFYLSAVRNQVRIGPYQRLDLRMNKTWRGEKWTRTLYAEVTNVTNKANYRFGSLDGVSPSGTAYVTVDQLFPILPSVGIVIVR